jgi:rSAM/selenodomain-associated transferase 2
MAPSLTIIVPTLNEASSIEQVLTSVRALDRKLSLGLELIVVDGGSQDNTKTLAQPLANQVIDAPRGRARQMNAGAAAASSDYLLFLHADTILTTAAAKELKDALAREHVWGRFDVRIEISSEDNAEDQHFMFHVISFMMNHRSRLTGIATGDQAIFVRRDVFESIGGFADQPLMEDVELSKQLRKHAKPTCLKGPVITSGRRWETNGVWATILLMWRLRWRYWRGESAEELARAYKR